MDGWRGLERNFSGCQYADTRSNFAAGVIRFYFEGLGAVVALKNLNDSVNEFVRERDWEKFHTPRNLLLALQGEVGELSELFQWVGDAEITQDWLYERRTNIEDEVADVFIYLLRLCHVLDIDLESSTLKKIEKNRVKYPIDKFRGLAKKYTEEE